MANENCLEGMCCPKCQSLSPVVIEVQAFATVLDDGIDRYDDPEWDDDSDCRCLSCGYHANVGDFKKEHQPAAGDSQ